MPQREIPELTMREIITALEIYNHRRPEPLRHPDGFTEADRMYRFVPEGGWPEEILDLVSRSDDGIGVDYAREREEMRHMPLFTEAFLYPLIGKEDARTLLSIARYALGAPGEHTYAGIFPEETD